MCLPLYLTSRPTRVLQMLQSWRNKAGPALLQRGERPRNAAVTADEADTKKAGDIISTRVRTPKNKNKRSMSAIISGHNSHNNYT